MKIYLLLLDHARYFFYSDVSEPSGEPDETDGSPARPRSGLIGWLLDRYDTFRSAWEHADSGALLWMRRAWDYLHTWAHPDETMLARLWSARRVDLHHPAARPADEVRAIWATYLRQQWIRHLVWLIVNGVIAPVSIVFALLPGPNLIGYWFAYRAIHHLMVVWGIRRVRRNKILTELHPIAALDLPIESRDGKMSHAALAGSAASLDEHVTWHSSSQWATIPVRPSLPPSASDLRPANSQTEQS